MINLPRHERLHLLSKIKVERKKHLENYRYYIFNNSNQELTFQPDLRPTRSKSFDSDRLKLSFMDRLALDCQKRELKDDLI